MSDSITINAGYCTKCHFVIRSFHRHDFVQCDCQSCMVDGGTDYLRFAVSEYFVRLHTVEDYSRALRSRLAQVWKERNDARDAFAELLTLQYGKRKGNLDHQIEKYVKMKKEREELDASLSDDGPGDH